MSSEVMVAGLVCLAVASAAGAARGGMPDELQVLWDMTDIRKVDMEPEKLSTRKAPLFVKGVNDWMRVGDSWVAAGPKGRAKPPVAVDKDERLVVEEWYYTSGRGPDGPNRVFGALACPEHATQPPPVILVFHGGGGHGSGALAVATARRNPGMAAFSMDYNGQFRPGGQHVTQWRTVTRELKKPRLQLAPDVSNYPMYHYVMAARRAIDFLEERGNVDSSRVGCFGISYGGWVALILAGVDQRVKCVVNGVSAGGTEGTASRSAQPLRWQPAEQRALWLATYDPIAYAPWTRAGVFFKICSNDRFFWLSGAMRNYAALAGPKRLLVTPNSDHGAGGPVLPDPSHAWVRQILLDGEELPEIGKDSLAWDGSVCTWDVHAPRPIIRAILHWSPGHMVSCARYWVSIEAAQQGDRWQARIPERYAGLAGQIYVTAFDARGLAVSSPTVTRSGSDPHTERTPLWPDDSLWDSERGADAWRPLTPGGGPKTVVTTTACGIAIAPANNGKRFCALTNSVVLASGHAQQHKGIRIVVNGNGSAGALTAVLVRDSNSLDETKHAATANYGGDTTTLDLPWSAFSPSGRSARSSAPIWPFNGLILEGERPTGSALAVGRITFMD